MTATRIRTARLGASLLARQKWRWALNVAIWVAIYVMPIVPGLITQAFFDRVSGARTGGFGVPVLVGIIAAYGVGRIAVMFWGMWVDIHFRFRNQTLLRRNLLARIYERPGAQALAETPGEALTRFREDVEEADETVSWTVDLAGILFFLPIALGIMASVNARVTAFVFVPMALVIFFAARARDRIRHYREAAREATGQVTGALAEMFGAVPAIKVAGAEDAMIAHFRRRNDARRAALVRDKTLTQVLESLFWNSVSIGSGITLVAAARSMTSGEFTVGDFALFVYFLGFVSEAVWVIGMFIARYQQARVSLQRMTTLLAGAPPERLVEARDLQLTGPLPEPQIDAAATDPLRELRVEGLTCH
ncbi:MAG: transporter ATP-binding protein, partial [Acidobacteria bacterium]|nr:transporter ATP-binding protein [Acidobacteriota bacterium]